jgi:hypothetical protein
LHWCVRAIGSRSTRVDPSVRGIGGWVFFLAEENGARQTRGLGVVCVIALDGEREKERADPWGSCIMLINNNIMINLTFSRHHRL